MFYDTGHFAINIGPQALYLTFGSALGGASVHLSLMAYDDSNQPEYQGGAAFESVTGVVAAVPEPSTWAMMILGFAGLLHGLSPSPPKWFAKNSLIPQA
jgi:hypothetical protein